MSSSPPPKRRFLPEPVETTTKSSRKFVPEPVETTTKSSRRFAPEPVETTTKSSRRFAPEPVEMTAKSNRKFAVEPVETTTKSSRRFAPEPVETTSRSSKDKPAPAADDAKPRRRFAPQPVETTTRTNRAGAGNGPNGAGARSADASLSDAQASPQIDAAPQSGTRPRRKFSPQLIETAKRTRKAGDVGPAVNQADRTEATPEAGTRSPGRRERPLPKPVVPANTPTNTLSPNPHLLEARRMGIPLRSDSISSNRSHSFRVPDLDTIESSESEEEGTPSLSTSPSAESESEQSNAYYDATRRRESVDERFSGYLLEIAAKAAENQMREAAMAAFPNDDHHEPVSHFMAHEDEEDEVADEIMADINEERRESFTKVNWELLAMQKHMEEKAEKEDVRETEVTEKTKKAADQPTKKNIWGEPQWGAPSNKSAWGEGSTAKSPWGNPFTNQRGRPDEREMQGMQRGARPPMLGSEIVFPRCPSPEPARFDVTQGSEALRNSMCYLTEQAQPDEPQGLWRHDKKGELPKPQSQPQPQMVKQNGFAKEGRPKPPSKLWSSPGSRPPSPGGLWNGCCLGAGSREGTKQAGMLTPRIEVDNPFDSPPPTPARAPPSPPPSNPDMASIDDKLAAQQALEEEFSDAFVTQVYNYLSLGYPSLARKFDDELSKISRIPVEELRQDDELAQARGYIRLGEDSNAKDAGITEDTCMRWRALRVYIYEWAKQQPRMLHAGHALGGFGVGARRGSWAW